MKDNRVALSEQTKFMKVLDKNFIKAKFVTLENADHGMNENSDHVKNIIVKFLNSNA